MSYNILIIDEEKKLRERLNIVLRAEGYNVIAVENSGEGLMEMKEFDFDIVMTDIDGEGSVAINYLKSSNASFMIIVLTGQASIQSAITALRNGAYDYIIKPCSDDEVRQVLKRACEKIDLQRKLLDATQQLKLLAITDSLTNVYNQRYFKSRLSEEYERSKRYCQELSCMMIDVDSFKKLNDTYGHLEGDNILKTVASSLKKSLRSSDLIARYGGDEFVVLLPQTSPDNAVLLARRIQKTVADALAKANKEVEPITLSLGISALPNSQIKEEEELLERADKALYMAKRGGKNRIEVANHEE